jgi:hypothetical protein
VAPVGGHCSWDGEKIWVSTGSGFWLYSQGASNDSEYPQKYASMFNGSTQRSVVDPEDGQSDTGSASLSGDMYYWKDRKISILDRADPTNIPRNVSDGIGCDFPNTITFVDHPKFKKSIFFLSTEGPAYLSPGGVVQILSVFKLAEVWPGGFFHIDPATNLPRSKEWKASVSASWHKNSWRIVVPGQTIPTIYGFFADPNEAIFGGFKETPATATGSTYPNDPSVIIPRDNSIAYSLSSKSGIYRISHYLKQAAYQDVYGTTSFKYHQKAKSKRVAFDGTFQIMGELSDALLNCSMKDSDGLTITAYTDDARFNASVVYDENEDTGLDSASFDSVRTLIQAIFEEGCYGRSFSILVDKTVPNSGFFRYFGVDMNVQPKQNFEAEFYGVSGERQNSWE